MLGDPLENGDMNEIALPSRHGILNKNPGTLRALGLEPAIADFPCKQL